LTRVLNIGYFIHNTSDQIVRAAKKPNAQADNLGAVVWLDFPTVYLERQTILKIPQNPEFVNNLVLSAGKAVERTLLFIVPGCRFR
jgi:hypothetical protein